ncbi:MAG: class I SAM-dependent methyltransferase [Pseudomonadales bacterium]|nr:class I SAM-dependent methyltransferase [Pseudomonadales bacterium]MCP5185866.1 class I SAM-dependent methyltransferase [Pseudomonadales bacterium]
MQDLTNRDCSVCGAQDHRLLMQDGDSAYRSCVRCQAIFASPLSTAYEAVNDATYAAALTRYVAKIDTKLHANLRALRPFDRYRLTNRFLEVGCNAGATLLAARRLGWQPTGVDIARAPTAYAREELGMDVFTGTVEAAGLPDDTFDVAYSNAVLEHVEQPVPTLLAIRRTLRPGGVFFADTVNWDSYTRRILGIHWRYLDPGHHVQLFTPGNVHELARRTGFTVLWVRTSGVRLSDRKRGEIWSAPWYLHLAKAPLSLATRVSGRGDSIRFLLRKPENTTA